MGEVLSDDMACINGLSISPKREFCVVKVWVNSLKVESKQLRLPSGYTDDIMFKSWY